MTIPRRPWRKSSYSANTDNCVEVALGVVVGVRDTKSPVPELEVRAESWRALLAAVRD